MIVLGITETHCATAAVLRDGRIVGCASEERFSRLKNDSGYPRRAIDALLRELDIRPDQIDLVALAGARAASREWLNRVLHDEDYAREYYGVAWPIAAAGLREEGPEVGREVRAHRRLARQVRHLAAGAPRRRSPGTWGSAPTASPASTITPVTRPPPTGARASRAAPALVLTNDNSGDGLCATASTGSGLTLDRHEATPSAPGSLGAFYSFVTLALGMKFGEHEYKVMGMAPYAPDKYAAARGGGAARGLRPRGGPARALPLARARRALPAPAARDGGPALRLGRGRGPAPPGGRAAAVDAPHAGALRRRAARARRRRLHEREGQHAHRPGGVGRGAVRVPVVRRRVQRGGRGLPRLPAGVRAARGRPRRRSPSAPPTWARRSPTRRPSGSSASAGSRGSTRSPTTIASRSASPSCWSPTAWWPAAPAAWSSARAPSATGRSWPTRRIIGWCGLINRMIKNRDFWMPFAPTVLAERAGDYLVNPKGLASPYMMLAMPTRPEAREALAAAIHPQDATARPQILEREWNPEYHAVIREFERRTGVGAVLNTSFNLHGEPDRGQRRRRGRHLRALRPAARRGRTLAPVEEVMPVRAPGEAGGAAGLPTVEAPCFLCGARRRADRSGPRPTAPSRCPASTRSRAADRCGFLYQRPRVRDEHLADCYPDHYPRHQEPSPRIPFKGSPARVRAVAAGRSPRALGYAVSRDGARRAPHAAARAPAAAPAPLGLSAVARARALSRRGMRLGRRARASPPALGWHVAGVEVDEAAAAKARRFTARRARRRSARRRRSRRASST